MKSKKIGRPKKKVKDKKTVKRNIYMTKKDDLKDMELILEIGIASRSDLYRYFRSEFLKGYENE